MQSLTSTASAFVRRLCHTAYIWCRVNDCESRRDVPGGLFAAVPGSVFGEHDEITRCGSPYGAPARPRRLRLRAMEDAHEEKATGKKLAGLAEPKANLRAAS